MSKYILLLYVALAASRLTATEGMWLPLLLQQLNEAEMKSLGMKLNAEDIYNVNKGSLKDAIVHFGGFCTGELISGQGLVLTNHHCGMGAIRSHSTLENNYLEEGFWARDRAAELPNAGLFVTFIVRMEEVSDAALRGVTVEMPENLRQSTIDRNINRIVAEAQRESWQDAMVRPFYHGNQYYLFITETYRDVRLVGAPSGAIGKFGADTDNWVWPRHTGDFALFRVYADAENRPAAYSPDNVPLRPRHFLPISLDGVAPGDFTMVFGFPGRTFQYLPATGVEMQVDVLNPIRIGIRDRTLAVMDAAMKADARTRIQYASKQASIANAWKKWIGENQGIKAYGGLGKKRESEAEFTRRVQTKPEWREKYSDILPEFERLYKAQTPYAKTREYVLEIAARNVELFQLANTLNQIVKIYDNSGLAGLSGRQDRLFAYLEDFHDDYRPEIDQQVLAAQLTLYYQNVPPEHLSAFIVEQANLSGKDMERLAELIFERSLLPKREQLSHALKGDLEAGIRMIKEDFAYRLARDIVETNEEKVLGEYQRLQDQIDALQRRYMQALLEVFPERRFYPDANSTLRVSYGQVDGYRPRDAVRYEHQTYLDGVMEKYQPGDYEFDVPEKLRQLHAAKDYGPYAENGKLPVCFIGSNHTTGGNSGSPAIDAHGNLIGLNFDRVWEGTMSDMYYDPAICRNIMVDIRYVLFIIDKYAGAGHLIEEMKLVRPKAAGAN
jgi:hypothetical protein